jgi:hypothetical protein
MLLSVPLAAIFKTLVREFVVPVLKDDGGSGSPPPADSPQIPSSS